MGEPDSMSTDDVMKQLALGALGPSGRVPARILRETGLHRELLQLHYQSLRPEIKYLVGWKPLREHSYTAHYRAEGSERRRAATLTETWLKALDEHELADEHAVQIFDGEQRPMPAPDYRLFVLRDGRMLYYAGGLYGSTWGDCFACGDVLHVLDVLDKRYSAASCATTLARQPFLVILEALAKALEVAIRNRERKVQEQRALQERLTALIKQVSVT